MLIGDSVRKLGLGALIIISLNLQESAVAEERFPLRPHAEVTPGSLCQNPDSYRYPEKIPYCKRAVSSRQKWEIIDYYDEVLGYRVRETGRYSFKVDHLVPLCMGGSNENHNLWPQHESVYEITDFYEGELCRILSRGEIRQRLAIDCLMAEKNSVGLSEEKREENFEGLDCPDQESLMGLSSFLYFKNLL